MSCRESSKRIRVRKHVRKFRRIGKLFAIYGSLRRGEYNHRGFSLSNPKIAKYIEKGTAKGFRLYSVGPYPYALWTGKSEDEVVVEVFRIVDSYTSRAIDQMERGAGYEKKTVKVYLPLGKVINARIYYFSKRIGGEHIPSGDWIRSRS